jgi:hypothetical protein
VIREPKQTCQLCGSSVTVTPDGRGFPPDVAKRKLKKICNSKGCKSFPQYTAGLALGGPVTGQSAAEAPSQHP